MEEQSNSIRVDLGKVENTCFVVMPFGSLYQTQYERVIRPAIEELGLKCIRGDEIYSKPNIMSDIWKSIRSSRLLIAELTGRNANVFYEIGLAHAIGKPIILLTRNEDDVPFDLKALRYRYYDVNDPFWGENLRNAIQSMVLNVLEQSEISTYLEDISGNLKFLESPKRIDLNSQKSTISVDVTGNWKASWRSAHQDVEHQGIIHITQRQEQLLATLTVTIESDKVLTVVQEELTGILQDQQVSLNGVSYTFIHQGNSEDYYLDNFKLKLTTDDNSMIGEHYDIKGETPAIFIRHARS
jgi:hypothetical protein